MSKIVGIAYLRAWIHLLPSVAPNVMLLHLQHTGLRGSLEPLLEEADIDKDGKISLPEFRRLLRTASMSSSRNVTSPSGHRKKT